MADRFYFKSHQSNNVLNRRTALRQFAVITAGVFIIPSCMEDKSKASMLLTNLKIDGEQEKLLAELSETIIPATDTPGAKDLSVHLFVLQMVDDCFKQEDQRRFQTGLKQFEQKSAEISAGSFVLANKNDRNKLITGLETNKQDKEEINYFYSTVKRLTIQGYSSSEYYLTNVQVYEMIPGRYKGCVAV